MNVKKIAQKDAAEYVKMADKVATIPGYYEALNDSYDKLVDKRLTPVKSSRGAFKTGLVIGVVLVGLHETGIDKTVVRYTKRKTAETRTWLRQRFDG